MQGCLEAIGEQWYLDSGCSRHITSQESHFKSLKIKDGGEVAFGGNEKGKIIGIGDIGNTSSNSIKNVLLVVRSLVLMMINYEL